MAIREASDMLVYEIFNSFSPVQFSEMEMILASVIRSQPSKYNSFKPLQFSEIDMILPSVI